MRDLMARLGELWCIYVHKSAMWPMNGKYRCAICLREYAVPFEVRQEVVTEHPRNVLPIEAGAEARSSVRLRVLDSARSREKATHARNSIPA